MLASGLYLSLLLAAPTPKMTVEQVKQAFNEAIFHSNGAKLFATYPPQELNGATAKACTEFLNLVTKPRIPKVGSTDMSLKYFTSILDPKSSLTVLFLNDGGANILIAKPRKYAFETPVYQVQGENKATTGFATLAFWAAHQDPKTKAVTTSTDRAIAAHRLLETWIPKFKKMGIKGSIEPETRKYMNWSQVLDASRAEIKKLGGRV
jgi:hypothetical protein